VPLLVAAVSCPPAARPALAAALRAARAWGACSATASPARRELAVARYDAATDAVLSAWRRAAGRRCPAAWLRMTLAWVALRASQRAARRPGAAYVAAVTAECARGG
jgi:hypothetical protein